MGAVALPQPKYPLNANCAVKLSARGVRQLARPQRAKGSEARGQIVGMMPWSPYFEYRYIIRWSDDAEVRLSGRWLENVSTNRLSRTVINA